MTDVLLRDVEVDGARVDVLVIDGRVEAIGGALAAVAPDGDAVPVVEGRGGALLPGLHDHHVHLLAMAARLGGVDVDDCVDPASFDARVRAAAADGSGWLRVGGHDEHRHGERPEQRKSHLAEMAQHRHVTLPEHLESLGTR